jgi:hypothetical protein
MVARITLASETRVAHRDTKKGHLGGKLVDIQAPHKKYDGRRFLVLIKGGERQLRGGMVWEVR